MNLSLMGVINNDLTSLSEYMKKAHEYVGVALPRNYPVFGEDAFETGTGVHASAVVKAMARAIIGLLIGSTQEYQLEITDYSRLSV